MYVKHTSKRICQGDILRKIDVVVWDIKDTSKGYEMKQLNKTWDKMQYKADFDTFLNVILAALERREEDYMNLIGTLDRDIVNGKTRVARIEQIRA